MLSPRNFHFVINSCFGEDKKNTGKGCVFFIQINVVHKTITHHCVHCNSLLGEFGNCECIFTVGFPTFTYSYTDSNNWYWSAPPIICNELKRGWSSTV